MMAFVTLRHYLKRAFTNPVEIALMTLLPVGIIFLNVAVNASFMETELGMTFLWQGYNIINTNVVMNILVMFMFMSGAYSGEYYFRDLRRDNRWRLNAAPVAKSIFVGGAIGAGVIFSFTTVIFVMAIGYFFFNIYLGNLVIIVIVILLVILMSQFIGIIVALFANTAGAVNGIMIALSFAMSSMIGAFLIPIPMPEFVRDYIIPYGVALRAVVISGRGPGVMDYGMVDAIPYIGILLGMTVVSGIAALVIARRRQNDYV